MITFDDIRPYNDSEAVRVLHKAAFNPLTIKVSRFLFPDRGPFYLSGLLRSVESVDDFQNRVMYICIKSILDQTSDGVQVSGLENIRSLSGGFVVISNHRDIVMDPAILEYVLMQERLPLTELCVGSNLLSVGYVRNMMRCNRMIKVMRGLPPRETYESSGVLSAYIRKSVGSGRPVWIAQREGRAKDSRDATGQAVLKMLDMSGGKSFIDNWMELQIVPMSISYEYESCDALRARELYIRKRDGSYVKKKGEDLNSILTGIRQRKGHIHIHFSESLSSDEILAAAGMRANERYKKLCELLDAKINGSYALWKTNRIAADILAGCVSGSAEYTGKEASDFRSYVERQIDSVMSPEIDREELRDIFLRIYANPCYFSE